MLTSKLTLYDKMLSANKYVLLREHFEYLPDESKMMKPKDYEDIKGCRTERAGLHSTNKS